LDDALADVRTLGARDLREKYLGDKKPVERPQDGSYGVADETLDPDPTELSEALSEAQAVAERTLTRELAWLEVRDALSSGAPYPRLNRDTLEFLFSEYAFDIERTVDDEDVPAIIESRTVDPDEDEVEDEEAEQSDSSYETESDENEDDEYYDPPEEAAWEEVTKRAASRRRPVQAFAEEQGWKLVDKDNPKQRESWAA